MSVQGPDIVVKKSKEIDEQIRSIYVNYMQLMLESAKDEKLKKELFSDNKKRVEYLNKQVGMTIPNGVHVMFRLKGLHYPKIHIKDKDGQIWIDESDTFKILEKLSTGEEVKTSMKITTPEELDVDLHQQFKSNDIILQLPWVDPSVDHVLFELKYEGGEIVFTTCIL